MIDFGKQLKRFGHLVHGHNIVGGEANKRTADTLKADIDRVDQLYASDANRRTNSSRLLKSGLILVGAAIAGFAQISASGQTGAQVASSLFLTSAFWQAAGVFMVLIGGVWTLFAEPTAPQALQEARSALETARNIKSQAEHLQQNSRSEIEAWKRQCRDYGEHTDWLGNFASVALAMREIIEGFFASKDEIGDADIQDLLTRMLRHLNGLIGYDGNEYWTLAVFRPSEEDPAILRCIAKERADRTDNDKKSREWDIGEGLVGHVFMTGQERIIEDTLDDERAGWLNLPNKQPGDDQKYRSILVSRYLSAA